jgi:hypothetical protein
VRALAAGRDCPVCPPAGCSGPRSASPWWRSAWPEISRCLLDRTEAHPLLSLRHLGLSPPIGRAVDPIDPASLTRRRLAPHTLDLAVVTRVLVVSANGPNSNAQRRLGWLTHASAKQLARCLERASDAHYWIRIAYRFARSFGSPWTGVGTCFDAKRECCQVESEGDVKSEPRRDQTRIPFHRKRARAGDRRRRTSERRLPAFREVNRHVSKDPTSTTAYGSSIRHHVRHCST